MDATIGVCGQVSATVRVAAKFELIVNTSNVEESGEFLRWSSGIRVNVRISISVGDSER
jgi:hypothetical protein